MATNYYFSQGSRPEQNLYEDIVIEALKMYGQDVYYLPRDIVNEDRILGEDVPSKFNSSYKIEMYIENIEGFDGEGDLFTKFGVEIRDQATFIVSRRRWDQTVKRYDNEITTSRPAEGDLLYIPFSRKLFQIMHVEHEQPFYQLKNLPTYKLRVESFEYNDEQLATGITGIDEVEDKGYTVDLTLVDSSSIGFIIGNTVTQTIGGGVVISAEITNYNDSSNVISLAHVGADDGKFHLFTVSGRITSQDSAGNSLVRTISAINENVNQVNAQNNYFDSLTGFLDFTESNPFGDPSQ
jgi:hypothetical protein